MARNDDRNAVEKEVKTWWDPTYGVIAFPNFPFDPPNNAPWAQFNIVYTDTRRASLGSNDYLKRAQGTVQFDLFCPRDIGTIGIWKCADYIESHWDGLILQTNNDGPMIFDCPNALELSGREDTRQGTKENWFRVTVDCPWHRDARVRK